MSECIFLRLHAAICLHVTRRQNQQFSLIFEASAHFTSLSPSPGSGARPVTMASIAPAPLQTKSQLSSGTPAAQSLISGAQSQQQQQQHMKIAMPVAQGQQVKYPHLWWACFSLVVSIGESTRRFWPQIFDVVSFVHPPGTEPSCESGLDHDASRSPSRHVAVELGGAAAAATGAPAARRVAAAARRGRRRRGQQRRRRRVPAAPARHHHHLGRAEPGRRRPGFCARSCTVRHTGETVV